VKSRRALPHSSSSDWNPGVLRYTRYAALKLITMEFPPNHPGRREAALKKLLTVQYELLEKQIRICREALRLTKKATRQRKKQEAKSDPTRCG
jgi:hypothetical protein